MPGRPFYVVFDIAMVILVSLGFLVRPGYEREDFVFWFWIPGMLVDTLTGPYPVQYAILRRFRIRPRRRK